MKVERDYYVMPQARFSIDEMKHIQEQSIQAYQKVYQTSFEQTDEVISLLGYLQPYTNNLFIELPLQHLLIILKRHGYEALPEGLVSVHLHDRNAFARFIIGQAMTEMEQEHMIPASISELCRVYQNQFLVH